MIHSYQAEETARHQLKETTRPRKSHQRNSGGAKSKLLGHPRKSSVASVSVFLKYLLPNPLNSKALTMKPRHTVPLQRPF